MADTLSDLLGNLPSPQENLFSLLESFDNSNDFLFPSLEESTLFGNPKRLEVESVDLDREGNRSGKRRKVSPTCKVSGGQTKVSHITVERNRRKQMNENLSVLRSLMPCFYVKRGDQASIIAGVIDYIKELQQVLHSLEAKKQRKVYSDVLSPRTSSSPRPLPLSPRPSPLSPRMVLPISPRTPQSGSPYKQMMHQSYLSPRAMPPPLESPTSFDATSSTTIHDLAANSKSSIAEVEVKFSGANVLLKTVSHRIPGQAVKIVSALESHSLEILHVSISTIDDTMLNSFTIKIGIECELSAEELAQEIQRTFT